MNRTMQILSVLAIGAVLVFSSCSFADKAVAVNDLKVTKIDVIEKTSATNQPPITYDVTVSWSTSSILADEKASAAFDGLTVYMQSGSAKAEETKLEADAKTYKFTGLLPGESMDLRVKAVYPDGTYPDASFTDYTGSISFKGGPWYDETNIKAPKMDGGFGVGSFNQVNSMPTGSYYRDQVYYYNPANTGYQFDAAGEVIWLVVAVNEVTVENDKDDQRNNVQWLNQNFQLLDGSLSGLDSYNDIARVDASIYDIFGNQLLSIASTTTAAVMSSYNFTKLLASVDSGYYADNTGYYFIKAECKSMPLSYSESNNEDKYGLWGFANNGSRR